MAPNQKLPEQEKTGATRLDTPPLNNVAPTRTSIDEEIRNSAGARTLRIEGATQKEIQEYLQWVDSLVRIVTMDVKEMIDGVPMKDKYEEKRLCDGIVDLFYRVYGMSYGVNQYETISESLKSRQWDCDASAIFFYDIAKKLGLECEIGMVLGHAVVFTSNYVIETTDQGGMTRGAHSYEEFQRSYGRIYARGKEDVADSLAYATSGRRNMAIGTEAHQKGDAEREMEFFQSAERDFRKALELLPNQPEYLVYLGVAYAALGRLDAAAEEMSNAVDIDKRCTYFRVQRAQVYLKSGNFENAENDIRLILRLDPYNRDRLCLQIMYANQIVDYYSATGDYQTAIEKLSDAIYVSPPNDRLYAARGEMYLGNGEFDKAEADAELALRFKPDSKFGQQLLDRINEERTEIDTGRQQDSGMEDTGQ